jgi:outer membrane protein assembly factor BamB
LALGIDANNQAKQLWRFKRKDKDYYTSGIRDAILKDGFLYTFTDEGGHDFYWADGGGQMRCVDLKTGETKWVEKSCGRGTMVLVDGCLLCLTTAGDLLLVDPKPDGFKLVTEWKGACEREKWLHHGSISHGMAPCWSIPVVARGKLYIHYSDRLICYDLMN